MKLITFLMLAVLLTAHSKGISQTITFSEKNVSLTKVFSALEEQTGYVILYSSDLQPETKSVSIHVTNKPLYEFLDHLLQGQAINYTIQDKTIFLSRKAIPNVQPNYLEQPTKVSSSISGQLLSLDNQKPIGYASVAVKGSNLGSTTDEAGNFSLIGLPENAVLIISSIGFSKLEISIEQLVRMNAGSRIHIKDNQIFKSTNDVYKFYLSGVTTQMDELIVHAGYYDIKNRERTGSISRVSSETIEKQPVTNPMAALIGRVPGLEIVQTGGTIGSEFTVRLRGQNSIGSGNDPLFIIDGIPFNMTPLSVATVSSNLPFLSKGLHPLNTLNPNDILSVEVLKDADATAIYGSRGGNGVILISTKKGKVGKTKLDLNASTGMSMVSQFTPLLNTAEYLDFRETSKANANVAVRPVEYDINGTWDRNRYTDWQKVFYGNTAQNKQLQAGVSGGSATTNYLVKAGIHNESTVYIGDFFYKRYSLLANLNHQSADGKFRLNFGYSYNTDHNNASGTDLVQRAFDLVPNAPALYKPDGSLNWENGTWVNPLVFLNKVITNKSVISNTNFQIAYSLFKNFELRTNFGYSQYNLNQRNENPSSAITKDPATNPDPMAGTSVYVNNAGRNNWIVEPQLQYRFQQKQHKFEVLAGSSFQKEISEGIYVYGLNFPSDDLMGNLRAAKTYAIGSNTEKKYLYTSVFGRINYQFKERYILNATGRRDGSTRFGPGNQFANFGALGAAWIFSEDSRVASALSFIDFGKLRASYGITGNDQISDFEYLEKYSVSTRKYDDITALLPNNLSNSNFGWETNQKFEMALELRMLNSRIQAEIAYYRNQSSNQLIGLPLPGTTGFSSVTANFDATVQNAGWEFELYTANINKKDFKWNTTFNITLAKNKLVSYPNIGGSPHANTLVIGESVNLFKVYQYLGVNPQTGYYQIADLNDDGVYNVLDRIAVNLDPKYYGGLTNSLSYKRIKLDMFWQFSRKNIKGLHYFLNNTIGSSMNNVPRTLLDRWEKPGDVKPTQRWEASTAASIARSELAASDGILEDVRYAKLRNVYLSYSLPSIRGSKMEARIFAQGQNLATITNFKGGDPEVTFTALPSLRVITLGINLTL